jgi:hypothetical protein
MADASGGVWAVDRESWRVVAFVRNRLKPGLQYQEAEPGTGYDPELRTERLAQERRWLVT